MRQRVKSHGRAYSIPSGLSAGERELAVQTVGDAVDALPPGTPRNETEATVDEVRPFCATLAEQSQLQRLAAEQARQRRDAEDAITRQKRDAEAAVRERRSHAEEAMRKRRSRAEARVDALLDAGVRSAIASEERDGL